MGCGVIAAIVRFHVEAKPKPLLTEFGIPHGLESRVDHPGL